MKILFIAPLENPESTAWLILKAMRNLGLEVEAISYREYEIDSMNAGIFDMVENYSWDDVIFVVKGESIYPEILRKTKARKILWHFDFDSHTLTKDLIDKCSVYNKVLLTCYPWVEQLRELGINAFFMPQATDPSVYHPTIFEPKYACDVAFIGSWKPGREEILLELKKDFDLKVFGNGWDTRFMPGYPVYLDEFNKVCSSAKVILNITPSNEWPIYEKTFSQRIYMVMAAGGYLVTDRIPGLPLKWLGVYENLDELKEIIRSAIEDKNIRKHICQSARTEILQKHTYYHRVKEIMTCHLKSLPYARKNTQV